MRLQEHNILCISFRCSYKCRYPCTHDTCSCMYTLENVAVRESQGHTSALLHALRKCIENLRSVHVLALFITTLHLVEKKIGPGTHCTGGEDSIVTYMNNLSQF